MALSPTASIGSLFGSLSIVDPAHPATTYVAIPVTAHVTGDLTASVEMLVFGGVSLGKGGVADVMLSGAGTLGALTASSDSQYVSVRVLGLAHTTLHAELLPDAPAGPLHANVTITTPKGVRLLLPVVADVVAAS